MDVMGREDSRIGLLPASAYVQAFAEGRCLEPGRGNEEIAFGRAACLDVNAEIVEMAKSGPGYAGSKTPSTCLTPAYKIRFCKHVFAIR